MHRKIYGFSEKEGTFSPLFLYKKMDKERVITLMNEAIADNESLFLIEYSISNTGDILIIVDGDSGVSLDECIRISRHIEHNLDREIFDFSLQVTSPDIAKPLVHLRQYHKNIGRVLKIRTATGKYEGELLGVEDNNLLLTWKTREPKPIGKGKHTVVKQVKIDIVDIVETKVKIVYN